MRKEADFAITFTERKDSELSSVSQFNSESINQSATSINELIL